MVAPSAPWISARDEFVIWMSSTAMNAPRQAVRIMIQSTSGTFLSLELAVLFAFPVAAMVLISAYPYLYVAGHAWTNQLLELSKAVLVENNFYWHPLDDLREIARRVVWRQ